MKTEKDTNEQYHSRGEISASGLKTIYKKSVYHHLNQIRKETSAMSLGTAVHTAMLEPDVYNSEYYVVPKLDLRKKVDKILYQEHIEKSQGKKVIGQEDSDIIQSIMRNFNHHELAKKYCNGIVELSHYGEYKGVPVRVRPDVMNNVGQYIADVKTCQDNSPRAFRSDIYKWAYHLQAAAYSLILGFPIENFRFIAVETKYPFTVEVYGLSEDLIEQGINAFHSALEDWRLYLNTGIIQGYKTSETAQDGALII
jgi:exodeoxyribonuclease VIII